jgi:hypothetical protein
MLLCVNLLPQLGLRVVQIVWGLEGSGPSDSFLY